MAIIDLRKKHCVPCEGGFPPLTKEQIAHYSPKTPDWKVSADDKKISRDYEFKDFMEVLGFVNKVAKIAEEESHHPDLSIHGYKFLRIDLSTHSINGLSENDFILAAKIDAIEK